MNDQAMVRLISDLARLVRKHGPQQFRNALQVLGDPAQVARIRDALQGFLDLAEQPRSNRPRNRSGQRSDFASPPRARREHPRNWESERENLVTGLASLSRSQLENLYELLNGEDVAAKTDDELKERLRASIHHMDQKAFSRFKKRALVPEDTPDRTLMGWAKLILTPEQRPSKPQP